MPADTQHCPRCRRDLPREAYTPSRFGKPWACCRGCHTAHGHKAVPRVPAPCGKCFKLCGHKVVTPGWCFECYLVDVAGHRLCAACRTFTAPISQEGYCAPCAALRGATPLAVFRVGLSKPSGFSILTPEQRRERAGQGGRAAQAKGTASKFTSETGAAAGKICHARGTAHVWTPEEARLIGRTGGARKPRES